jgi:hypothetical protein
MVPKQKPDQVEVPVDRDEDQAWYWSEEWQRAMHEAEEDIHQGRFEDFDSMDDFLVTLDD